jgi:CheY-like chemotaxis protein
MSGYSPRAVRKKSIKLSWIKMSCFYFKRITNVTFHCLVVPNSFPTMFRSLRSGKKAANYVAEARKIAEKEIIDLVISDIGLPDGSGYTLMSELRDGFGLKGIALTGYGMEHDVAQAHTSGFEAHLTKPVRIESLEKALNDVT